MSKYRVDCWDCGGEGVYSEGCTCWDDTCCCLEPEPPGCQTCRGKGFLIVSELTDDNCQDAVLIDESPAVLLQQRGRDDA